MEAVIVQAKEIHGSCCLARGCSRPASSLFRGASKFEVSRLAPSLGYGGYAVAIGCCATGALRVTVLARPSGRVRGVAVCLPWLGIGRVPVLSVGVVGIRSPRSPCVFLRLLRGRELSPHWPHHGQGELLPKPFCSLGAGPSLLVAQCQLQKAERQSLCFRPHAPPRRQDKRDERASPGPALHEV